MPAAGLFSLLGEKYLQLMGQHCPFHPLIVKEGLEKSKKHVYVTYGNFLVLQD
jgi:hypothetical protein